jgi:hypothetical protein
MTVLKQDGTIFIGTDGGSFRLSIEEAEQVAHMTTREVVEFFKSVLSDRLDKAGRQAARDVLRPHPSGFQQALKDALLPDEDDGVECEILNL